MKTSFLFTATVEKYMEDVLFKLFNVKANDFQDYKLFLSKQGVSICRVTYDFAVGKD